MILMTKLKWQLNPSTCINVIQRFFLWTKYKSFVKPHLDCGDVIYGQSTNSSLSDKIESVQYNAMLAITGAVRRTLSLDLKL